MRKLSSLLQINYFHFQGHTKDDSRSKKMSFKKLLFALVLLTLSYGTYCKSFQTYIMYATYSLLWTTNVPVYIPMHIDLNSHSVNSIYRMKKTKSLSFLPFLYRYVLYNCIQVSTVWILFIHQVWYQQWMICIHKEKYLFDKVSLSVLWWHKCFL